MKKRTTALLLIALLSTALMLTGPRFAIAEDDDPAANPTAVPDGASSDNGMSLLDQMHELSESIDQEFEEAKKEAQNETRESILKSVEANAQSDPGMPLYAQLFFLGCGVAVLIVLIVYRKKQNKRRRERQMKL